MKCTESVPSAADAVLPVRLLSFAVAADTSVILLPGTLKFAASGVLQIRPIPAAITKAASAFPIACLHALPKKRLCANACVSSILLTFPVSLDFTLISLLTIPSHTVRFLFPAILSYFTEQQNPHNSRIRVLWGYSFIQLLFVYGILLKIPTSLLSKPSPRVSAR